MVATQPPGAVGVRQPTREPARNTDALPGQPAGAAGRRLAGIDVARAVAVVGMLVVNSRPPGGDVSLLWQVAHGRASLLFVLLAGIGVSLLAHRTRHLGPSGRATMLWRAALLLPVGLVLELLAHGAKVILPTYSVLFVLAIAAVRLPDRWLVALVAGISLLGPVTLLAVHQVLGVPYARGTTDIAEGPAEVAGDLLLFGGYPLVTWTAPFLLGILLGRLDLAARAVRVRMVVTGAVVAAAAVVVSYLLVARLGRPTSTAGPDHLAIVTAHSQMPLWLISGTAAAVAVVGGMLMLADALGRAAHPLVATGQLALTLYVGHLLVLHALPDRGPLTLGPWDIPLAAVLCAGGVIGATAWRAVFRYGPLERLMRVPSARTARRPAWPAQPRGHRWAILHRRPRWSRGVVG